MSRQTRARALVWLFAAVAPVAAPLAARAAEITQIENLPPTTTNFNARTVKPFVFQKFDPAAYSTKTETAILDSVTLDFTAHVENKYTMIFTRAGTITETLQPGASGSTPPSITLFQPDGKTPLLTAQEPNDLSSLSRTVTYGFKPGETFPSQTFSSSAPASSPYYIAPGEASRSESKTLNAASDLALFTKSATGPNSLSLPIAATAFSSNSVGTGNGAVGIATLADAQAKVKYVYHLSSAAPQTGQGPPAPHLTPEPATLMLWGAGGVVLLVAGRARRRA